MTVDLYPQIFYATALYLLAVLVVSMYNFWRAPPPTGHRPYLMAALVLFGLGVFLDGGSRFGLVPEVLEILADPLQLLSVAALFHVTRNVLGAVREREAGYAVGAAALIVLASMSPGSPRYYFHLVVEFLAVGLAVAVVAMWVDIHRRTVAARNLPLALLLLAVAVATHGLAEFGVAPGTTEAVMLVSSVAAASFWLDASFDIADGRL